MQVVFKPKFEYFLDKPVKTADFNLGKPPIIEWWIRCGFAPPLDGSNWDWVHCLKLLHQFQDELPLMDQMPRVVPKAEPVLNPDTNNFLFEASVEPLYFRRRSQDLSKAVQIGENQLVAAHHRRDQHNYPGFSAFFNWFSGILGRFHQHFGLDTIESLELHNADLVVVPDRASEPFELADFLVGAPTLPKEPFGNAFQAEWSAMFACSDSRDYASVSVSLLPPDGNDVRFRIDWHYWCFEIGPFDQHVVAERLRTANSFLNRSFRAIVKDSVWDLFEPQ